MFPAASVLKLDRPTPSRFNERLPIANEKAVKVIGREIWLGGRSPTNEKLPENGVAGNEATPKTGEPIPFATKLTL